MKRKLVISLVILILIAGSSVTAYHLFNQNQAKDTSAPSPQEKAKSNSNNATDDTKDHPATEAAEPPKKPEAAEATSEGVIKQKGNAYTLHVENAPSDLALDLSEYKGNIQQFIGKKVVIRIAQTKTVENKPKIITLVVKDISLSK